MMTSATAAGCDPATACDASTSLISEPARTAMSRTATGLIARSAVATTAHDGTNFHAGVPVTTEPKQFREAGRWVRAKRSARSSGTSAPTTFRDRSRSTKVSVLSSPASGGVVEGPQRRGKGDIGVAGVDLDERFPFLGAKAAT